MYLVKNKNQYLFYFFVKKLELTIGHRANIKSHKAIPEKSELSMN